MYNISNPETSQITDEKAGNVKYIYTMYSALWQLIMHLLGATFK